MAYRRCDHLWISCVGSPGQTEAATTNAALLVGRHGLYDSNMKLVKWRTYTLSSVSVYVYM